MRTPLGDQYHAAERYYRLTRILDTVGILVCGSGLPVIAMSFVPDNISLSTFLALVLPLGGFTTVWLLGKFWLKMVLRRRLNHLFDAELTKAAEQFFAHAGYIPLASQRKIRLDVFVEELTRQSMPWPDGIFTSWKKQLECLEDKEEVHSTHPS